MSGTALRVIHALGWYFPESSGGTEVYVDALAGRLASRNVESTIVAAIDGAAPADYQWNGHAVHRYEVPPATHAELRARRPHERFAAFADWLRAQRADIYHQHSWTRGCGVAHLRLARDCGFRTVLTVHVPSVVCLRGTMMLHGETACDGRVTVERCTSCWGQARGIPGVAAALQARAPRLSTGLAALVPEGRLRTALATPALVGDRRRELEELARIADRVVAVCGWLEQALLLNGVPRTSTVRLEQAVDRTLVTAGATAPAPREGRPYRVGFLGRWDIVKGVDTLVNAVRSIPRSTLDVELVVHALPGDAAYESRVRALAAGDPRIRFEPPVARGRVSDTLRGFDVLAVPSRWLETGPLVALEAFAAGRPVLGSDLGGLRELIVPDVNGRLVPGRDAASWADAILAMADRTAGWRIPEPRTTDRLADEMRVVYDQLLAS